MRYSLGGDDIEGCTMGGDDSEGDTKLSERYLDTEIIFTRDH